MTDRTHLRILALLWVLIGAFAAPNGVGGWIVCSAGFAAYIASFFARSAA